MQPPQSYEKTSQPVEKPLPTVGLTYEAKAISWDIQDAKSGNGMVVVNFNVKLYVQDGKNVLWSAQKALMFPLDKPEVIKRSMEALHYLGFVGTNFTELAGSKGSLPDKVEVTIGPPRTYVNDKQVTVTSAEPTIDWVNPLGGIRMGTKMPHSKVIAWCKAVEDAYKAAIANPVGSQPNGNVSPGMPVGFNPSVTPQQPATDDDIPF
jgi:hypothetical protein